MSWIDYGANSPVFDGYSDTKYTAKYRIGQLLDTWDTYPPGTFPSNFIAELAYYYDGATGSGEQFYGENTKQLFWSYIEHSGHKWASPILSWIYDTMDNHSDEPGFYDGYSYIPDMFWKYIVRPLLAKFRTKWDKLYATYQIQYDVLNNYEISIVGSRADSGTQTNSSSGTRSNQGSSSYSKTVYSTDTLSHGHNIVGTATGNNNTFGFNTSSADGVPYAKSVSRTITNNSGSDTKQINGTDTSTDSNSSQVTDSLSGQGTLSNSRNYSETRSGRFGNFAPQDLIRKQMELWKEPFFNEIFNDIDTVLALKVY